MCMKSDKINLIKSVIQQSSIYRPDPSSTKLLFISGPSGCGKSTLIRLLSQTMSFELVEWQHPSSNSTDHYVSTMRQFEQFINLSIRRHTLSNEFNRKVIFIDDLPDITTPQVRRDFHTILRNCLHIPIPFLMVFVISHAWMTTTQNRHAYETKLNNTMDIIPQELEQDRRVTHIKLNAVSKTLMVKALNRVIQDQDLTVTKPQLDALTEASEGDIRSAINHLQFYAKRQPPQKKRKAKVKAFDEKIGPLDLFHAVGKVLYGKRNPDGTFESKPEHIFDKLPVDPDLFNAFLHQNSLAFFDEIEAVADAFDYLSVADTIRSHLDWQDHHASLYRSLVTMYGLMEKPTKAYSFYRIQRPELFDAQSSARQKKRDDYHEAWMASVAHRTAPFESAEKELLVDDPIEDFSEDEFEEIYGDDAELALLMDQY
ncbi:Cell cycle checkpoint protein RAD17 [Choanephora cucurbitarum]|uniref:Cell cycle checkpoint protein RAD17 n=1 Tax=Choanephora cucurbitarum TaxID=101091 RepID=A0A1C7NHP8_9FUNG|nr:Cell cycle checkpoint protein RAD17 [Choanephora cucurbitarum]